MKNKDEHTIYIFAHDSQIELAECKKNGLCANVGQTSRTTRQRLNDPDYKAKQAGGKFRCYWQVKVPTTLRDHHIHQKLKKHSRVRWTRSANTEEFRFLDDSGDAKEATRIVEDIIKDLGYLSMPLQSLPTSFGHDRSDEHYGFLTVPSYQAFRQRLSRDQRSLVRPLRNNEAIVNDWEEQFLTSIEAQVRHRGRRLTNKQKKKFYEICNKYNNLGYSSTKRIEALEPLIEKHSGINFHQVVTTLIFLFIVIHQFST
jgi:hypothetical protein